MKVICPNIMSSVYAQKRLKEVLGVKPMSSDYFQSQTFTIVFPPCYCCEDKERKREHYRFECQTCVSFKGYGGCPVHHKKDKPIICSDDGKSRIEEYVSIYDALSFLKMTEHMETNNPPQE